jgi:FAD dependent oxidoreductase
MVVMDACLTSPLSSTFYSLSLYCIHHHLLSFAHTYLCLSPSFFSFAALHVYSDNSYSRNYCVFLGMQRRFSVCASSMVMAEVATRYRHRGHLRWRRFLVFFHRMTSISVPQSWSSGLPAAIWNFGSLLLATLLMAQPSLSVPLRPFELSQAVLASYHDDVPVLNSRPLPDPQPVSLPVRNPTKSFWVDSPGANPLANEGSEGALTEEADICIIGSGITGVSAAWHLAKMLEGDEERKVVVLEAREFCEL